MGLNTISTCPQTTCDQWHRPSPTLSRPYHRARALRAGGEEQGNPPSLLWIHKEIEDHIDQYYR